MGCQLRNRPDGQVEIVENRPVVVGVFADHGIAVRVLQMLTNGVAPASALPKVPVMRKVDLEEMDDEAPRPPAWKKPEPMTLTEGEKDKAFERIAAGEKVGNVAAEIGVSMPQLRAAWAHHCRSLQAHLQGGGLQSCGLCGKPFTPSISNPENCARCSHDQ